jgi:hypothetical protein
MFGLLLAPQPLVAHHTLPVFVFVWGWGDTRTQEEEEGRVKQRFHLLELPMY